ncbi:hypothetical protein SAMN05660443_0567 [Marinospirillum celere]|uniref:Uncharacterized protein n=1 Tax=Marinospirillum celere TaxID=1122252 RepID=A0A1I1EEZ4_9GAMM|nr:DUF6586 family protein [Marinospirillum celere]SFB85729.1 hypothetical protein SAMN05660443_0567 [Marinospirillum celere]
MIQAQRRRVNQKLYQAELLLKAAQQSENELNLVAWQQACHEAALNALEAAQLAFLREVAAVYRLPVQAVSRPEDLQNLAEERQQRLPELQHLQGAWRDPVHPLSRLEPALKALRQTPAADEAPQAGEWMPEFAEETQPSLIPLVAEEDFASLEEKQLAEASLMLKALKELLQELREQLLEQ